MNGTVGPVPTIDEQEIFQQIKQRRPRFSSEARRLGTFCRQGTANCQEKNRHGDTFRQNDPKTNNQEQGEDLQKGLMSMSKKHVLLHHHQSTTGFLLTQITPSPTDKHFF